MALVMKQLEKLPAEELEMIRAAAERHRREMAAHEMVATVA
jgi:hypothetical protein